MVFDLFCKSVQKILGFHGWNKVPHVEIRRRANVHCMEHLVMQRQLRWVGHIIRMQSNRLPRRVLYSELQLGQRAVGGQKKRFSDQLKEHWGSAQFLLLRWRHWRPIEKSGGGVWRGLGGLRHQLRPGGRCSSSSLTHGHKRSCNWSSLPHFWQSLCIRFWIKESSPVPSSVIDQLAQRHCRSRRTTSSKLNSLVMSPMGETCSRARSGMVS